jgi:hypothetical protein
MLYIVFITISAGRFKMKKALLLLVLTIILGVNIYAQESHKNAIYTGSVGIIGFSMCYERMILPNFSLGFDFGTGLYIFGPEDAMYISLQPRWYPLADTQDGFFVSFGLGYCETTNWSNNLWAKDWDDMYGLLLSPGMGFKIGFGKPRGFVLIPALRIDVIIGEKITYNYYTENNDSEKETKFGVAFTPVPQILFGYAF